MIEGSQWIGEITRDELRQAFEVLTKLRGEYESNGRGWAALVEAQRLISVEMRIRYGDAAVDALDR